MNNTDRTIIKYPLKEHYPMGFGLCFAYVMCDTTLSIQARCVFSLLSTFVNWSNGENSCFPERETIYSSLKISRNLLSSYLEELKEHDLIIVERRTREGSVLQNSNVYTLNLIPSGFRPNPSAPIVTDDIREYGYGLASKELLLDKNISLPAKALYLYTMSVAGQIPNYRLSSNKVQRDLDIKESTFNHLRAELGKEYVKFKKCKEIVVDGIKIISTDIPDTYYRIELLNRLKKCKNSDTEEKPSDGSLEKKCKNSDTGNGNTVLFLAKNCKDSDTVQSDTVQSDTAQSDSNNNIINNNIYNNNIPQSFNESPVITEGRNGRNIIKDIEKINALPEYVLEDPEALKTAVYYLCDYKNNSDSSNYEDTPFMSADFRYSSFMLCIDALLDLLSDTRPIKYNNSFFTRTGVLTRINRYICRDIEGNITLIKLIEDVQNEYKEAAKITEIKIPMFFMRRMILNVLINGSIQIESQILHDFPDLQSQLYKEEAEKEKNKGGHIETRIDENGYDYEVWVEGDQRTQKTVIDDKKAAEVRRLLQKVANDLAAN